MQGAHVRKHSTVYSNACSIVRYAYRNSGPVEIDVSKTRHNGNLKHAQ